MEAGVVRWRFAIFPEKVALEHEQSHAYFARDAPIITRIAAFVQVEMGQEILDWQIPNRERKELEPQTRVGWMGSNRGDRWATRAKK